MNNAVGYARPARRPNTIVLGTDGIGADMEEAVLFRIIATVDRDTPVGKVDDWKWQGPTDEFAAICKEMGADNLLRRARAIA